MGIIGSIRKHSWVAVVIVGIAIVSFIIGDLTKNQRGIPDLAKINNTTVTAQRFNELTEEMELNYKRQQGVAQIPADVENQIREQVWQNLVNETLTEVEFDNLGLTVTSAEVSDMYAGTFVHPYLRQMFTDPKTGVYNTQAIQYYIDNFDNLDTASREQWVELTKQVKNDRRQQKYSALIARGLYMPKAIAEQVAAMGSNLSSVRVAALPYQTVSDEEAVPTEADYKAYYEKHKAEFRVRQELRDIQFVVYPVAPTAEDLSAIQEEVMTTWEEFQTTEAEELPFFVNSASETSYDSTFRKASSFKAPLDSAIAATGEGAFIAPRMAGNEWVMAKVLKTAVRPDSIRSSIIYVLNNKAGGNITRGDEQAKQLADSVMNVVKSGSMNFEDACMQFSDDQQKADTKGDQGWMLDGGYGFVNEQIVNTPVNGMFVAKHPQGVGYLVVKVTDKTVANKKYRVAMINRGIRPSEATSRNIFNQANRFAGNNRTYQEMVATAQAENLPVRNAMIDPMANSIAGISNARSLVQWAFNEKTAINDVADQVFESEDMYIVAAVKDIYTPGFATLDQVRSMIDNQVRIEKKAEILKARAEEAVKAGSDINAIAAKLNVAIDSIDSVSFNDYFFGKFGMEPKVQAAIAAANSAKLLGPIQGASGVYMVQIDSTAKAEAQPADAIRSQMEQTMMQKLQAVSQVLKDNAKIIDQRNKFF